MGFPLLPYSVVSVRSPLTRVYLARYVPLPGFLNLLAAFSSDSLAGLFHPADTPGIRPFRAFSSWRAGCLFGHPLPSWRCLPDESES